MKPSLLPTSLFGRAALIVLLPSVLLQLVTAYIFYERHWASVQRHLVQPLIHEVAYVASRIDSEVNKSPIIAEAYRHFKLHASWRPNEAIGNHHTDPTFAKLANDIESLADKPATVFLSPDGEQLHIMLDMQGGTLDIRTSYKRVASSTTYIFVLWMVGSSCIFLLIALLFLRNQVKPIQQLALASQKFGRGLPIDNYRPRGASEVRRAGQAFLDMRRRIMRHVEERTRMLSAISHDLRTPLTRMKLQLSMMNPNESVTELRGDVEEMDYMIGEYLDFMRGIANEETEETTLKAIIEEAASATSRAESRSDTLTVTIQQDAPITVTWQSMQRALVNILRNALHYGTHATIHCWVEQNHAIITIDDDGDGIAEDDYARALQPFERLDDSRHRSSDKPQSGGVGLGLAISNDIINRHGGTLQLDRSPKGGLRVWIRLPI